MPVMIEEMEAEELPEPSPRGEEVPTSPKLSVKDRRSILQAVSLRQERQLRLEAD